MTQPPSSLFRRLVPARLRRVVGAVLRVPDGELSPVRRREPDGEVGENYVGFQAVILFSHGYSATLAAKLIIKLIKLDLNPQRCIFIDFDHVSCQSSIL